MTDQPIVCIPVTLDAFVLNETLCAPTQRSKIAPLTRPNYSAFGHGPFLQPDVLPHIDLHAASPAAHNTRITDVAGTGKVIEERLGVYLHWCLPRAFRAGMMGTESAESASVSSQGGGMNRMERKKLNAGFPGERKGNKREGTAEFRPVPDRWIVLRMLVDGTTADGRSILEDTMERPLKAYLVESNRIRRIDEIASDVDVETETAPFLNRSFKAHEQDAVFMGRKINLDDAPTAKNIERRYQSPLTVVDSANPLFADYQPHNSNVFSIHDEMTVVDTSGNVVALETATVSYLVLGYYAEERLDPFTVDKSAFFGPVNSVHPDHPIPSHAQILQSCFMKLVNGENETEAVTKWLNDPAESSRLLCHGARNQVKWERNKPPAKIPAEEIAQLVQTQQPISVGIHSMDAFQGFLESRQLGPPKSSSDPDSKADIRSEGISQADTVHSLATAARSTGDDVHSQQETAKTLLRERFRSIRGGTHWHFGKGDAPSDRKDSDDGNVDYDESEGPKTDIRTSIMTKPTDEIVRQIYELNTTQELLDASRRHRRYLQRLLFFEWWKYRSGGRRDNRAIGPDEQRSRLHAIDKRVQSLARDIKALGTPGQTEIGKISALKRRIQSIAGRDELAENLKQGIRQAFCLRKDPTVALMGTGLQSPWPEEFTGKDLDVRLNTHIPAFSPSGDQNPDEGWKMWPLSTDEAPQPIDFKSLLDFWNKPDARVRWLKGHDSQDKARWIFGWRQLQQRYISKTPKELKQGVDALVAEWMYLAHSTYSENTAHALSIQKGPGPVSLANEQPFFPLFIEWEAEYFHIPFEYWRCSRESDGTVLYTIDNTVNLATVRGIRQDRNTLSGRSLLLPSISAILKIQVQELLKRSNRDPGPNDEPFLTEGDQRDLFEAIKDLPILSAKLEGLTDQLLSCEQGTHVVPHVISSETDNAGSTTFTRLFGRRRTDQGPFNNDILALLETAPTTSTPYTSQRSRSGMVASNPFKPVTHGQVRFKKLNLVDKFGQVVCALDPENQGSNFAPLLPYTSKSISCQADSPAGTFYANTVIRDPEGQCQFFQLAPSINQDVRLNHFFVINEQGAPNDHHESVSLLGRVWSWISKPRFEDVSCQALPTDIPTAAHGWRPAMEWENPVWGWLLINYRDGGLQIYNANGEFHAEALLREKKVFWRPENAANFSNGPEIPDSDDSDVDNDESSRRKKRRPEGQLDLLMQKMRNKVYLRTLMEVIRSALENTQRTPSSYGEQLPAILGRPLALVNMGWSLELAEPPLTDPNPTNEDTSTDGRGLPSVLDYEFELSLGDDYALSDGLVGYFDGSLQASPANAPTNSSGPEQSAMAAPLNFDTMYTAFGRPSTASSMQDETQAPLRMQTPKTLLKPYYVDPQNRTPQEYQRAQHNQMKIFGALIDPFGQITGYTGILPPVHLQLPPWVVETAVKQMMPFFRVGPVLVPGDIPAEAFVRQEDDTRSSALTQKPQNPVAPSSAFAVPAHVPAKGDWIWLQPHGRDDDNGTHRDVQYIDLGVKEHTTNWAPVDGPHTVLEGYLQLKTPLTAFESSRGNGS